MIDPAVVHIPVVLDLAATGAGALTGGLMAVRARLPTAAVVGVALANGFGGGLLRDVLLGKTPPVALQQARYIFVAGMCALVCVFAASIVRRLGIMVLVVDALGTALFGTVGAAIALSAGLGPLPAILVGSLNAIGGGLLRDLIAGFQPDLAKPGPITSSAGVLTAVVFVSLAHGFDMPVGLAQLIAITMGVAVRLVAEWKGVEMPLPYDVPERLLRRQGSGSRPRRRMQRRPPGGPAPSI